MNYDIRHIIDILMTIYEKTVDNKDLSRSLGFGSASISKAISDVIKLLLDLDCSNHNLKFQNNSQENKLKEYRELFEYELEWYSEEQKKAIKDFIEQHVDKDED